MALFSNTLAIIRQYLSGAVGDLIMGNCGTTDATTQKIHAPFLWQANDYYNNHKYEVYVYAGTNIGVTKRVTDWVLGDYLLTVHSVYDAACDATSYVELHRIFTENDYRKAINLAIEALAGKYLVDVIDDTTITLVADTYEYLLPTNMLYLTKVTTEHDVDGDIFYDTDVIDSRDWSIIKAYPPYLKLRYGYYSITADKDLRLEGQGTQDLATEDSALIYLPPDWLVQKAITFLPQNKIQSNDLDATYRQAMVFSTREPRVYPNPRSQRIIE